MSLSTQRPSLWNRWQALMHRWSMDFGIAWGDFLAREVESYSTKQKRKNKAFLDVDPLESRQMPSFGLSLYANAAPDPFQGQYTSVGRTGISVLDGSASQAIPLYVSRADTGAPINLVYNSNSVTVNPIVTVQLTSAGGDPIPSSIDATLTFNGSADTPVHFTTTGHSAGDTYLLGVQHATQITSSGNYAWSMSVTVHITGQSDVVVSANGSMPVVVRDTSSDYLGRGWSLQGLDSLVIDGSGALYVYGGTGGARYFTGTTGTYTNPANDFGTFVKNGNGSYTYTAYDQVKTNFDSNGRITTRVDPHSLTTSYTFDGGGKLTRIDSPDGANASFTYDGSSLLQTVLQPGSLTLTMAHASASDLTSVQYPDGANRTFTYSSHRLTKEQFGDQTATLTYSSGMLSSIDRGGSSSTTVTPELSQGLTTTPAKNASAGVGVVTDPLSHAGTYVLDTLGRTTKFTAADGGIQQWTLNSAGLPTKYTDQLNHVTSFTYGNNNADVTKIEYPDGGVVTMGYDSTFHTVTSRVDQLSNHTTMTYDATLGDLLTIKDANNGVTTMVWGDGVFNPKGLLLSVTDQLNHTTTYTYGGLAPRQLTTITDAANNKITYTYDTAGRVTKVERPFFSGGGGPGGSASTGSMAYDGMGRITQYVDALSNSTTFAYDAIGQMTDTTDALTRRSTFAYDTRGNMTGETDAVGTGDARSIGFSYDAANQMTARTDGLSHTTTLGYDAVGRVITVKDALGNVSTTTYDVAGNVTAVTDPLGHTTSFGFDSMNRQTTVTDALTHVTTTAYDLAGNVRSVTDALGVVTSYAYDVLNRQTRIIEDKGGTLERTTTIAYDAVGNVSTVTDPLGHVGSTTYDAIYRVLTQQDGLGHTTTFAYNVDNREVAQTIDALGNTVTRTYDRENQLLSIKRPGGGAETFTYDAVGNKITDKNELSNTTTYTYDNLNRLTQTTDPLNGKTTFIYDAADNRTVVVDPVANRTTSAFDAVNRLTTETDPNNHSATFAYDAAGRMTGTTDRLGRRRDFTYDDTNNKLTEKWYANGGSLDQTQTWTYDGIGQTLSAVDPDGANTFTYDALHRVKTAQEPFGLTLTYSYDAADNRTVFQDSKGGLETFAYDAANRLTSVKFTNSLATVEYDFTYDARDSITKLTRFGNINGTATVGWTSFTYDTRGRLTNEQHRDSSNTSLNNTTFTYDNFDRLTTKVVDGTTITYSYDNTNQVTSDGTRNYSYDANGNRNSAGYTTGTGNQTTNDGTWTYTYDNEGNLSKKSKGTNLETWNYSYDQQNHLVTVEKHATDGGTLQLKVQYKYDALGNRIERTEDSDGNGSTDVTQRFGYDGANVWADLDGSSGLTYRRLFGQGVDNPVARVTAAGTVVWYLTDHQHSVIGMVDYLGASLGAITYDPYGNILTDSTGVNADRFKYTAREWDSSVKLQYNRARYFDPGIGKWISMDPLGFGPGDANLYRYVANEVAYRIDPTGLDSKPANPTKPIGWPTEYTPGNIYLYWPPGSRPPNFQNTSPTGNFEGDPTYPQRPARPPQPPYQNGTTVVFFPDGTQWWFGPGYGPVSIPPGSTVAQIGAQGNWIYTNYPNGYDPNGVGYPRPRPDPRPRPTKPGQGGSGSGGSSQGAMGSGPTVIIGPNQGQGSGGMTNPGIIIFGPQPNQGNVCPPGSSGGIGIQWQLGTPRPTRPKK
jgi:RHS repeat-associated protein